MCNVMIFLISAWMIGTFFVSPQSCFFSLVLLRLTERSDPAIQHITHFIGMAPRPSAERCQLRLSHSASRNFWNWYRPGFPSSMHATAAHLQASIETVQEDQDLRHTLAGHLLCRLCLGALLLLLSPAQCRLRCNRAGEGHHYCQSVSLVQARAQRFNHCCMPAHLRTARAEARFWLFSPERCEILHFP